MKDNILFLKGFLTNFRNQCSIFASTKYLANSIVNYYKNKKDLTILEIGGGTGSISCKIANLSYKRFDILELDSDLSKILKEKFKNEIDINVLNQDLIKFEPTIKYDLIVCCLPLSNFSQEMNNKISNQINYLLKKDGSLCYFEYLLLNKISNIKKLDHSSLKEIDNKIVFKNIPPAKVHFFKKI